MKISQLAEEFLSYYRLKGAKVLPSSSLIHSLFPMSFNMSAGLVQLDPLLRLERVICKKMVVVQKCFRHFDMARVADTSHLSFFEMGGYFEVGKINKERSLQYIYNFLVEELKIEPERLWVTVFSGGEVYKQKFVKDDDVFTIWKKLLPNKDQIVFLGKDYNFWVQGGGTETATESKLCGSQTEIFIDLGKNVCKMAKCQPNCPCGRFLEISNNLFITHKITGDLRVLPLANMAVESVIGLERVVAVVEKKSSVYEIEDIRFLGRDNRIIDHIRALCFLITDGAPPPGRNGRARIIRTLIRELLTTLYVLNLESQKTIDDLIKKITYLYSGRYPEILRKQSQIHDMIFDHEQVYLKTLEKVGVKMKRFLQKNDKVKPDEKDKEYFRKQFGIPLVLQGKYLR